MHFEKLRLTGFKSFVEPTEFIIESGLTGVVGPNGCGKSNLVEALRWVMGESSYKNMRASGMDDVIFSGSVTRPARNMAEVSLFLDNGSRTAPAAFNDDDQLQVTRRIEREAGSAYKINGREARARDVQLLFADQSTGARSPSMVGQGRIGELIQAKPQARRALLEEAAGISGLHSRRHEAELRLRAAETNLERLEDVVAELESQIESLKRQARQANRFRTLSRDIRAAEATLLHLKWTAAKAAEADAQSALSSATAKVAERAQAQMEAARDQAVAQKEFDPLRQAEAEAAAALQRLTIARDQLDAEIAQLDARRKEYVQRVEQLLADKARETALIAENEQALARLDAERVALIDASQGEGDRRAELADRLSAAKARLDESEANLARATAERAEASALRGQLQRRIEEMETRAKSLIAREGKLRDEANALDAQIAQLPDADGQRLALSEAETVATAAEQAAVAALANVEQMRSALDGPRDQLLAVRERLGALETEARTIAKLLQAASGGLFAGIIETLSVSRGYETALGAVLGDDLEAPDDPSAPAHWSLTPPHANDPALPEGCASLEGFVSGSDMLKRRLAQIGVVDDRETGAALAKALKPGQRLVTRDGDVWRWDGYHLSADAPTVAAQRLAHKNRLSELDGMIAAVRQEKVQAEAALADAQAAVKAAIDIEAGARNQAHTTAQAVRQVRQALSDAEQASGDVARRRAVAEESLARLTADRAEAERILAQARTALAAEPALTSFEQAVDEIQIAVSDDRAALAECQAAHDTVAREAQLRRQRLETIDKDRDSWIARIGSAKAQITALDQRQAEITAALKTLDETPDAHQARRRQLVREIESAQERRTRAADAVAEAENRARQTSQLAQQALADLASVREDRVRAEERAAATADRTRDIAARIVETLNCQPHEAFALTGLTADDPLPETGALEKRLDRFRAERERLGAVNLRAEEEQTELIERLTSLTGERDDVLSAIAELRAAIGALNKEGRERLVAAFDEVCGHFTRLFTHLFGGGTAELQLVESDDPLEAGLEIVARPPGKKPQTMTLLSGGEQALTALALIFAVFLTNPAPICVLDEVDAPLDDHNVERFCDLMDEMARNTSTRFLLITHNPITMARVDRLFGVTMAEQGVSQLVSVDLEGAEAIREAS